MPEPHSSPISSARRQAGGAPQLESLARSLRGGQLPDGCRAVTRRGNARTGSASPGIWSRSSRGSGHQGARRPRTRTTEARRFPPPSGPEDSRSLRRQRLTCRSPGPPRGPRIVRGRGLGDEDQHGVVGRVQADRAPQRARYGRTASPAQARRARDATPARTPSEAGLANPSPPTKRTWARHEHDRRADDRAARAWVRRHAVSAKPRNSSSSAIGAMTAPARRWSTRPTGRAVGGRGCRHRAGDLRRDDRDDDRRDQDHRPGEDGAAEQAEGRRRGRRQPMSATQRPAVDDHQSQDADEDRDRTMTPTRSPTAGGMSAPIARPG